MARRLSAAIVFAGLVCPLVLPFALSAEANLPACCRRAGQHHCGMAMQSHSHSGTTVSEKPGRCPCCTGFPAGAAHPLMGSQQSIAFYAGAVSHPAQMARQETARRISWSRSRQKRGPPVSIPS